MYCPYKYKYEFAQFLTNHSKLNFNKSQVNKLTLKQCYAIYYKLGDR